MVAIWMLHRRLLYLRPWNELEVTADGRRETMNSSAITAGLIVIYGDMQHGK